MTHRKQTLLSFIGCIVIIFAVKMCADYRYVVRKENRYKKATEIEAILGDTTRVYRYLPNGDTLIYIHIGKLPIDLDCVNWQILKRK